MGVIEVIIWFVTDTAFLLLIGALIVGLLLAWGLAAVLCRSLGFGARGCFSPEIKGFRAWGVAFGLHALMILFVGGISYLSLSYHWILLIPYLIAILADVVVLVVMYGRAQKLANISR